MTPKQAGVQSAGHPALRLRVDGLFEGIYLQCMNATFAELVAEIRQRSSEEKGELLSIIERELIETRREEMAANSDEARNEYAQGRMQFSSSVDALKREIE